MAYYNLNQKGGTNIHTDFRFELEVITDTNNSRLGLNDKLTAFITKCDVPCAPGHAIPWYMPGGMRNWQAGKRQTKDIELVFGPEPCVTTFSHVIHTIAGTGQPIISIANDNSSMTITSTGVGGVNSDGLGDVMVTVTSIANPVVYLEMLVHVVQQVQSGGAE